MGRATVAAREEPVNGTVRFDTSHHPILVLRMPARGDVDSIHLWYDETERWLREARRPIALVHDFRPVEFSSITAAHRRAIADRSGRLPSLPGIRNLAADARIVSNPLAVGAITAVSWLTGAMPWPQSTFSDESEALAWARARIDDAARRL